MHMMALGKPSDHYKLLLWMCVVIVRENLGSFAFSEVKGARFKRTFIKYAPNINGFEHVLCDTFCECHSLEWTVQGNYSCSLCPICRQSPVQFCMCDSIS